MTSVVQSIGDRVVGTVEEVSADRITVLLDVDAPQATALNTGRPTGFPRINNYVLIPNEGGATACVISSVRIQRFPFPMRKGMQKDLGAALLRRAFSSLFMGVCARGRSLLGAPYGGQHSPPRLIPGSQSCRPF